MNWTRVRIAIQMVILGAMAYWAMNCEVTCCKKDPSTPPGSTPSGNDGGPVSGGGTGSTTATNNLVDWTQPMHGEIMRPPLTYLFIHFLTEGNDNPNDDIDRDSFSVSDDVVLTATRGGSAVTPDISINSEIYWGWGGVMMLISGGGSVDTTYTFKIKKNGVTPIRTISGITMNLDVYVSITLKNGDGVPPTITSSTFDSLNLNYVPPHQPIEYFFSEDMSNARIIWLATKQGGQSVAEDPNKQVIGWYDHLSGYRFTIYNLGAGLDLDTNYEYTILGADMDPSLKLFLPPTMDPTGERMRATHTRRFRTSKVKITSPLSSSVRVIVGGQETDIIPTITSLPVKVGINSIQNPRKITVRVPSATPDWKDAFNNMCKYTREDYIDINNVPLWDNFIYPGCNEILITNPPSYLERDIYFKTPGPNEIITHVWAQIPQGVSCMDEADCNKKTFGGYDYIKVNVQPPERQAFLPLTGNLDIGNGWIPLIAVGNDLINSLIPGRDCPIAGTCNWDPTLSPFCSIPCIEGERQDIYDNCYTCSNENPIVSDGKVWVSYKKIVPPIVTEYCNYLMILCSFSCFNEPASLEECVSKCVKDFEDCNKPIFPDEPGSHGEGIFDIEFIINKLGTGITLDAINKEIQVTLSTKDVKINTGWVFTGSSWSGLCFGWDKKANVSGCHTDKFNVSVRFKPVLKMETDGVQRLKFELLEDKTTLDIGEVECPNFSEVCEDVGEAIAQAVLDKTINKMIKKYLLPLPQILIPLGKFEDMNGKFVSPKELGYRNIEDVYFTYWDIVNSGRGYKLDLKYLLGLRPNY